jgi:hypothetical protein
LKYFFQFSLLLLAVELAAAAAQTPPCSTLSSDEALFARATGACRDLAPIVDKASKGAAIVEKGSRAGRTAAPSTRHGEIPRSAAQSEAPSGRAAPAPVQQLHVPNVTGIRSTPHRHACRFCRSVSGTAQHQRPSDRTSAEGVDNSAAAQRDRADRVGRPRVAERLNCRTWSIAPMPLPGTR